MNVKHNTSEKGQAVVFLVVGLVVFLGFVALAIDGGMAYSDRRHSQNSSDTSSLSGGGAASLYMENNHIYYGDWGNDCTLSVPIHNARLAAVDAAINRAAANGFTIYASDDPNCINCVYTVCGVEDYGYEDRFIDVMVQISSTTETSFAGLLFPNALVNNVDSTTRVRPRMPLAFGNAIVALNPADCSGNSNGVVFSGSMDGIIHGGGVWSNGCMRGNGGQYGLWIDPPYGASYAGDFSGNDNIEPSGAGSVPYPLPPNFYTIDQPDCNSPDAWNGTGAELKAESPLSPGLYCVTSGDLRINANDEFSGSDVTIAVLEGDLRVNGGADVVLDAPPHDPNPSPAVPGLLFYVVPNHSVEISGNSAQFYEGLIYAPGGNCDISGTGDVGPTLHTQIICMNVELSGNASVEINFDTEDQYTKPTSIELFE